jgi:polyhydroxyalkanoate synthase
MTLHDVVQREGASRLLRFRAAAGGPRVRSSRAPIVLVPSLLQRWSVLDLAPGASVAASLVQRGFDVFCVDGGVLDTERHLDLDGFLARLRRFRREVGRITGHDRVALLGYSQGGTLATIDAALHPHEVAALVAIATPIDFARGGLFAALTDRRLLSVDALADAGGVPPGLFRGLIAALHPGATVAGAWSALADPDPRSRAIWQALEAWADDPVALPPELLRAWLGRCYQDNALVRGVLQVRRRPVALGAITAPVLAVVPQRDTICPPEAARALLDTVSSGTRTLLEVPGGHVSGVAGPGAEAALYPRLGAWLDAALSAPTSAASQSLR